MEFDSFFNVIDNKVKQIEITLNPEPITPAKFIKSFDKFQIGGDKYGQFIDRFLLLTDDWLHVYSVIPILHMTNPY